MCFFVLFTLPETNIAHENPPSFLVNTIKMVEQIHGYVSFGESNLLADSLQYAFYPPPDVPEKVGVCLSALAKSRGGGWWANL